MVDKLYRNIGDMRPVNKKYFWKTAGGEFQPPCAGEGLYKPYSLKLQSSSNACIQYYVNDIQPLFLSTISTNQPSFLLFLAYGGVPTE